MNNLQGGNRALSSYKRVSKLDAAGGAAAAITITGVAGKYTVVEVVRWSYSDAPAGGKLTLASTGSVSEEVDITAAGPGRLVVDFVGALGADVVITLAAPGGAIVGKLNASYTLES